MPKPPPQWLDGGLNWYDVKVGMRVRYYPVRDGRSHKLGTVKGPPRTLGPGVGVVALLLDNGRRLHADISHLQVEDFGGFDGK
jgi:hypothetical protein